MSHDATNNNAMDHDTMEPDHKGDENCQPSCANCGKLHHALSTDKPLDRCARCREAVYCSKPCQAAHWRTHKPDCKKPNYVIEFSLAPDVVVDPPIRRVISCPAEATFEQLHYALQAAFDWPRYRAYDFVAKHPGYDPPERQERLQRLTDHLLSSGLCSREEIDAPRDFVFRITDILNPKLGHCPHEPVVGFPDAETGHAQRRHCLVCEFRSQTTELYTQFEDEELRGCEWEYMYDFDACWKTEMKILRREKGTESFSCIDGQGAEVAESVTGAAAWQSLKKAYRCANPTQEQRALKAKYESENHFGQEPRGLAVDAAAESWSKDTINRSIAVMTNPKFLDAIYCMRMGWLKI